MNRIIMDESDLTPEELAQDELIPWVTPGISSVIKQVRSSTNQTIPAPEDKKTTSETPK